MKTRFFVCTAVLVALLAPTSAGAEEEKAKGGKLVGTWEYVSGVRAGEKVDKERLVGKVVFTKETITIPSGQEKPFVIKYLVNSKKSPATIDMEITDGPVTSGKALGVVEVKGDTMKICYVALKEKEGKRPEKLESTKENNAFFFELKRAK